MSEFYANVVGKDVTRGVVRSKQAEKVSINKRVKEKTCCGSESEG